MTAPDQSSMPTKITLAIPGPSTHDPSQYVLAPSLALMCCTNLWTICLAFSADAAWPR
jgi:hypothetical protein